MLEPTPCLWTHAQPTEPNGLQPYLRPPRPVLSSHWGVENFHICYGKLCKGYNAKGEQPSLGAGLPLFSGLSVTVRPGCSREQSQCHNAGFVQSRTPLNPAPPHRGSLTGGEAGAHPAWPSWSSAKVSRAQGCKGLAEEPTRMGTVAAWLTAPSSLSSTEPGTRLVPHKCVEKNRRMEGRRERGEEMKRRKGIRIEQPVLGNASSCI